MKRPLIGSAILAAGLGLAYAYGVTRSETRYRELILDGEAALARGETFAAIEAFSGAVAHRPDAMLGYLKRGEAYRRRHELQAALRDLRRAAELDPAAPRAKELLGDVNVDLQRYGRAAESYQDYLSVDDRSTRILYKLALTHYRASRPDLALEVIGRALALDDRMAEAHYLRGLCLRDQGDARGAAASLQRAVALAPSLIPAREELAELYRREGRADARVAELEELFALDPRPARSVALGLADARRGRRESAVLILRGAAERHPEYGYTYVALGRVWLEAAQARGDRIALAKALEALETAAATDGSSEALALYGQALLLASEIDPAERVLLRAVEIFPVDPRAYLFLADAAERLGHAARARQALLEHRAISGEAPDRRRRAAFSARVAALSVQLDELDVALTWYLRAVADSPADPTILTRLAEVQWLTGDSPSAKATVERALTLDPDSTAAQELRRKLR